MGGKIWSLSHDKLEELGKHFGFSNEMPKESPYYKEEKKTHTHTHKERERERERERSKQGQKAINWKI